MLCAPHLWSLLTVDVVVCFQRQQILVDGKERSVIVAYHVSDWIDSCWIGFKIRELTKFCSLYEGLLAQVSSMQPGSTSETIKQMIINRVDDMESDES